MASGAMTNPASVIVDANVLIALCAKEADKLANAELRFGAKIEGQPHVLAMEMARAP